jgi:hypothetical protein
MAAQQGVATTQPAAEPAAQSGPDPTQLTDAQLLGTAVAQKQITPEAASEALRAKKQADREPVADAIAASVSETNPLLPESVVKAALTTGGHIGDAAFNILTPILGGIIGSAEPGGGTAAGGAAGGLAGNAIAQAREYFRGERDDLSLGQLTANTLAGGIPVGRPVLAGMGTMIARRAAQGAVIGTGTAAVGQLIDNGQLDFKSLAESGGLGALFGGTVGGVEGIAARKLALGALRRTPEFQDFEGSDAELIAAARAKMAENAPAEKNVTGTAEAQPETADITKVPDAQLQEMAAPQPEAIQSVPDEQLAQMAAETPAEPVDIGPRDESVSTGTGVATPHEEQMMSDWKDAIAKEQATGATEAGPAEPISETPPEPSSGGTYGIAARVSEARGMPIEPGVGVPTEDSIEAGRDALDSGEDPNAALQRFANTGAIKASDMALVRARGEELSQAAKAASDQFGVDSNQYKVAAEADFAWTKAIKPMQTEWANIGLAQQGETDIDTGTFHGLRSAYMDSAGRDFTPDQAQKAQSIAEGVSNVNDDAALAKQKVLDAIAGEPTVSDVWKLAKQYLADGSTDYDDIVHSVAADLGKPVSVIREQLAQPKGMSRMTNDMYAKLSNQRQMVNAAKAWVQNASTPGWLKFLKGLPRVFFMDKVFGHGTVGMITHAGLNVFNPTAWKTYWPNFMRQFALLGWHDKGVFHEQMMQNLVRDPNFITARRAGLANDPGRQIDDYQQNPILGWLGKFGLSGNKGFDALKLFRQDRFNQIWNDLPLSIKNPAMAKLVASGINHATGVVSGSLPPGSASIFFAPKLELSRWAFMIGDQAKASKVLLNWSNETQEAKWSALSTLKQLATIAATYLGLLAVNQGLLSATGSRQSVNFTQPRRGDFLAFKAAGYRMSVISPMLGMVRLFANLLHDSMGTRAPFEQTEGSRAEEMVKDAGSYARSKLSPLAADVADVATQADYANRPLPFSADKVPTYLARKGVAKYTYPEYLSERFTPIPVSEAVTEVFRKQGMNETQTHQYIGALMSALAAGGTGARISSDTNEQGMTPDNTPLHGGHGR